MSKRPSTTPGDRSSARQRLKKRADRAMGLANFQTRSSDAKAKTDPQPSSSAPASRPKRPIVHAEARASSTRSSQPPLLLPLDRPFEAPPQPTETKIQLLAAMDANEVKGCTRCRLCETRTNTVFGEGDPDAAIFFIGEGPGENEDLQARPFVGRAGQLLDKMIVGMGLKRQQVYIGNIVKCRPPGNREPAPDEVATCTGYLERQLEIIRPRVIVTLGRPAAQHMLRTRSSMTSLRGTWQDWRGIRLMPTYHPAYILRNYTQQTRAAVWSDLQQVMNEIGLPVRQSPPT